jgi:hypothetical protein
MIARVWQRRSYPMKKWIQSNRASGAYGKRQVVLAGLLFLALVGGTGSAAWLAWRAPVRYLTVLEGEDRVGPYFTTLAVASPNPWQARGVALRAAKRQGLHIVRVAEMKATGPAPRSGKARVLRAPWEKTYYIDDDEPRH